MHMRVNDTGIKRSDECSSSTPPAKAIKRENDETKDYKLSMTANPGPAEEQKHLSNAEKSGLKIEDIGVKEEPHANSFNAIETRLCNIESRLNDFTQGVGQKLEQLDFRLESINNYVLSNLESKWASSLTVQDCFRSCGIGYSVGNGLRNNLVELLQKYKSNKFQFFFELKFFLDLYNKLKSNQQIIDPIYKRKNSFRPLVFCYLVNFPDSPNNFTGNGHDLIKIFTLCFPDRTMEDSLKNELKEFPPQHRTIFKEKFELALKETSKKSALH